MTLRYTLPETLPDYLRSDCGGNECFECDACLRASGLEYIGDYDSEELEPLSLSDLPDDIYPPPMLQCFQCGGKFPASGSNSQGTTARDHESVCGPMRPLPRKPGCMEFGLSLPDDTGKGFCISAVLTLTLAQLANWETLLKGSPYRLLMSPTVE